MPFPFPRGWWLPAVVAVAAAAWTAGAALPPWLEEGGRPGSRWVRMAYAPVCHQDPDRSLHLGGRPLAVCARCAGLYLGGTLGLAAGALGRGGRRWRLRPRWLAVALAPTALDAAVHLVTGSGLPGPARALISVPGGVACGLFLAIGLEDLARMYDPPTSSGLEELR
jgi:uncharacterized membrane protein